MENARDTFYLTLRNRLAGLNPGRTMVLRGVTRPSVLVAENELVTEDVAADAFTLRWTGLRVEDSGALPLVTMTCEVQYATDGGADNAGMDRGRALAAMDGELAMAVGMEPRAVGKMNYAVSPATVMGTQVFWGDVTFGAVKALNERVVRVATIEVFSYQEAGEL